jgi:methylated-DNA-[protein]-cysteine S-methyltransferase
MSANYQIFETALGYCGIVWNEAGVLRFRLPEKTAEIAERNLLRRTPEAKPAEPPPHIADAVAAAKRYFVGEAIDFAAIELDLSAQDELFKTIYAAARRVGYGQTTTYGALAKELGDNWELARDVGQAMAKNPVPLIIPCHRVLAAGNKLGGFSAPGGTDTKVQMLELEGVHLGPKQPSLGL